jgi:hypothetical protein
MTADRAIERGKWALQRTALAGALSLVVGIAAYAQQPLPATAGIAPLSGERSRGLTNLSAPTQTYDSFFGQDKTGPYPLTYKGIEPSGITVFIDNRPLPESAYLIDLAKGEVTFVKALGKSTLARVVYGYYPGVAQKNPAPASTAPLSIKLGGIQLSALPSGSANGATNLVLGFGGATTLAKGGLTSQFYLAPDASADGKTRDASTMSQVGVKLGYALGSEKNGLDVNFLRGGKDFAPAVGKGLGFDAPAQNLGVAARLNPSPWLAANFSQVRIHDLRGTGGSAKDELGLRLGGTGALPSLGFNRSYDDNKKDAAGKRITIASEVADFAARLGSTNLLAKNSDVETTAADGNKSRVQQNVFGLNMAAKNRPTLSLLRTDEERTDAAGKRTQVLTDNAEIGGQFGKAQVLAKTLRSEIEQPDNQRLATEQSSLNVALPALTKRSSLSFLRTEDGKKENSGDWFGTFIDKLDAAQKIGTAQITLLSQNAVVIAPDQKRAEADLLTLNIAVPGASGRPGLNLSRVADDKTDLQAQRLAVTTDKVDVVGKLGDADATVKTVRVTTSATDPKTSGTAQETAVSLGASRATFAVMSGTSQTGATAEQKQGVAFTLRPSPTLALTAEQKDQTITPRETGAASRFITSQGASAELKPMPGTTLTGVWRTDSENDKTTVINTYGAQFGHDKNALQLSGNMTSRSAPAGGMSSLDTARATFRVRPAPNVTITSGYIQNPEEKGVISPMVRREYGLDARVGAVELGSAYSITQFSGYTPEAVRQKAGADEYGEYTLSLGIRFDANTHLTGKYKDSFFYDALTPRGLRTFGLDFSHSLGQSFLTMSGTMITNSALVGGARNDYKAEAKFGVKF